MNILITGGASGLGASITRCLAKDSASKIFFTYNRSLQQAKELEAEFSNTKAIECDFNDEGSVNTLGNIFEKENIDVLVNNALTGLETNYFHKMPKEHFRDNFNRNVMPVITITQAAILHFRKKKSGRIITVLSSYIFGNPPIGLSEYVASKNYILSLSRSWAVENAKFNIVSNCISPTFMQTGLTADTDERVIEEMVKAHPLQKLLTTDEAALGVKHFLETPIEINGTNMLINSINDIK